MRFIELFAGIGGFRYGLEKIRCREQKILHNKTFGNSMLKGVKKQFKDRSIQRSQFTCDRNILQSKTPKGIQKTMSCIEEGETRFTCVYANEWDKYACQIYRKNFGNKRMCDKDSEVCKTTTEIRNKKGQLGKQLNRHTKGQYDCPELHEGDITKVSAESIPDHDILTAGFPCPTYSIAGKRKGFQDPRGIVFFEICRIAKVKRPALLLLENVKGLLSHEKGDTFRIILNSLSELGYDCEWEVLNSKNFGVPQNRERVFIFGHLRGTSGQKVFPLTTITETISKIPFYDRKGFDSRTKGFRKSKLSPTLSKKMGTGGNNVPMVARALGANDFKGVNSPTLYFEKKKRNLVFGSKIRRLTPTECERLQGFPDGWTEGISDTQRYKCLGNAVTVNVVEEIGKRIAKVQQGIF